MKRIIFALVPIGGYVVLNVLGDVLFLTYFWIFHIPGNPNYNAMIESLPSLLAILTVPVCSFLSFVVVTKVVLRRLSVQTSVRELFWLGATSLLVTVLLDLLITVGIEKLDILAFPTNLMYLFAYAVIIPSVILSKS